MLAAVASALALRLAGSAEADLAAMTPREKAAAVVVAGMPAGAGFAGVLVRPWNSEERRPSGSIVFADQEGGLVKSFSTIPPWQAASAYGSTAEAFAAGRATAAGLR